MALRGVKPKKVEKRLKALFFGEEGSGKTTASIQFPSPYLIDTEKGAIHDSYVELLDKNGGAVFQTSDWNDLITEVKSLLTEKHPYKTIIIDPLTTLYHDLLEKSAERLKSHQDPEGTSFGRHYGYANKQMKHLLNLLLRLDMNVIITSHSKTEYGDNMVVLGNTYDCYKKLGYLFDLVLEIKLVGSNRQAVVRKSRIAGFPSNDKFMFSYKEVAERYGNKILEKEAIPQDLINAEELKTLIGLAETLNVSRETIDKWIDKAECNELDELPKAIGIKIIDHLTTKLNQRNEEFKDV